MEPNFPNRTVTKRDDPGGRFTRRGDRRTCTFPVVTPAIDRAEMLAVATSHARTGVVVLDDDLRFVYVNPVAAEINGHTADEHEGRSIVEVLSETGAQLVPMLRRVLETGEPVLGMEVVGETPALPGETRAWTSSFLPHQLADGRCGVLAVFVEVTEKRRAERRLRQVIDGLFTFVGLCSVDGTLLEANEFAVAATGLSADELVGRPFWEGYWWSYDPEVQQLVRDAVERAVAGETSRFDVWVRVAGGELIPIDFQLVPIVEDGVVTALVPSAIDITSRTEHVENLAALSALSAELQVAVGMDELIGLIVDQPAGIFGSSMVTLGVVNDDTISVTGPKSLDADLMARWTDLPLDGTQTPFHDAVESREMVWVWTCEERRERYPELAVDSERAGLVTTVSAPLVDDSGVIGVIVIGWDRPISDDATLRLHVGLLANACTQALHRVIRLKTTTELVAQLTSHLLARRDTTDQLDIATAYLPAVSELGFGGDWYDVVTTGPHSTALVIGDVVGHDVDAAARMAITKSALRTAVLARPDLAGVSDLVTRSLGLQQPSFFATAVIVDVDLAHGRARWKSFGHPPAMVRGRNGSVRVLDATGPPIGLLAEGAPIGVTEIESGEIVVVYSDGLVENRDANLDDRLAELSATLAAADPAAGAEKVLAGLMAAMIDGAPDDDVAVIVAVIP